MKFKLPKDAQIILDGLLDNPHARKRALLIIEKSDVSDEVKDAFREAIKSIGEPKMPDNLKDALQVEGMKEYIDSVVAEKTAELQRKVDELQTSLDDANQNVQQLKADNEELKKAQGTKSDLEAEVKTMLVDQIADLALALRKSEINLEAVEDSLKAYKESLSEKETDELRKLHDELRAELHAAFQNEPSETVDKDVQTKDGAKQTTEDPQDSSEEESDGDEIELKDMASFLKVISRKHN